MNEETLFELARNTPSAERLALLDRKCAGNPELRARIEALLAADAAPDLLASATMDFAQTASFGDASNNTADIPGRDEHVGAILGGKYKLIEEIGEGGMGSVYMAQQTEPVKRLVAVKVIKAGMDSKAVLARFEAERQALAMMDHPNIAKVFDAGTTESGRPYFVMELVKGVPITQYCDERKLTPRQRLELFVPVCNAIQHAHQKGIIHRDIKPNNVLVALYDDRPVPKVIDFGVAKAAGQSLTDMTLVTGFGAVVGTPEYMSPEQANLNNLDIDTRSDVYSLGVLLYELLTGSTPVDRKSLGKAALLEVLRIVREVEAPRPSAKLSTIDTLPSVAAVRGSEPAKLSALMKGEIDWIVMKALEKDRTRRYDTANGLAADVRRYLNGDAVEACPPTLGYRLRKFTKRHKARIASGFLVALAVLVGVAGTIWQAAERRHEREVVRLQSLQTAGTAVDRAQAALIANRLGEVDAALAMIDPESVHSSDLTTRIETIRKDRDMLRELETIYEEYWTVCPSNTYRDPEKAKASYPQAFRNYGVPVGELSAVAASDRITSSLIAPALADGLATWFFLDPKVEGLRPLLDRLDPDEFRVMVRAAVAAENKDRLRELAAKVDPAQHPPVFSVMLAGAGVDAESYRILQAAWQRYPDSFAVVLALAFPEPGVGEDRAKERIGWSRMAVSLRPNNALAHYYLSLEYYSDDTDAGKATRIAALQRAIALAPRFANAHAQLGAAFRNAKRYDEAFESSLRATQFDPTNKVGQAGLIVSYLERKDWVLVARTVRILERLIEPEDELCLNKILNEGAKFYAWGSISVLESKLADGLIKLNRFYDLVDLYRNASHLKSSGSVEFSNGDEKELYIHHFLPACAAVQAAAGRGIDAPAAADRPSYRRQAIEWLSQDLNECELKFCEDQKFRRWLHTTMTNWQSEPMLADVRGAHIAELSKDEQEEWQQLWARVAELRDQTAPPPPELAPPPREKGGDGREQGRRPHEKGHRPRPAPRA